MNILMTPKTLARKRAEVEALQDQLSKTKEDMQEAKEQGDLSENFGYTESRKQVENLRSILAERTEEVMRAQSVDPKEWVHLDMSEEPRAMVGAMVTVSIDGNTHEVLLGGAGDEHPKIIPYNSPLGRAVIPKVQGTTVKAEIGEKEVTIKILKCRAPKPQEIAELYPSGPAKKEKPIKSIPDGEPSME
jgi:transcription elongation GreA/GreB family factor